LIEPGSESELPRGLGIGIVTEATVISRRFRVVAFCKDDAQYLPLVLFVRWKPTLREWDQFGRTCLMFLTVAAGGKSSLRMAVELGNICMELLIVRSDN
jgi:hypothetical protein